MRGMELLEGEGLNVRIIQLPAGMDPDEFIRREGNEGFASLQESAVNLIDYKVSQLEKEYKPDTLEGKINFTKALVRLLAGIDDQIKRDIYIQAFADRYNIDVETINKGIRQYHSKSGKIKDKNYNYRYTKIDNKTRDKQNINSIEAAFLKLYLEENEQRGALLKYLEAGNFTAHYQKLVKLLRKHSADSLGQLVARVDEDTKKQILALLAMEKRHGVQEIISAFCKKIKKDIYRDLTTNKTYSLGEINQLLLKFIRITA